jgi:tellurite resistance protein
MAKKDDFTEQEFDALQKGVTGAGLLVAVSDRGFFDTFKESAALANHVAAGKQESSSELVREIADVHGSGFSVRSKPEELETETLAALQTAKTTLETKAPDELDAYRQFVLDVAQSVADAAGGGEAAESGAIEKVRSALQ